MNYKTVKLSEVADISIGKTPSRNNSKYWDKNKESKNIWLSIRDMSKINDKYIDDSREYLSNEGAKLFNEVPKGTLIMSFKLSIGKLAITKTNLRTNEAIAAFKIKDDLIILRDYLYFFLKSIDWDRFAGDDIKVKGKTLNKSKLKEVLISFPKLKEQQRIVAKLDATFAKIDKLLKITRDASKNANILLKRHLEKIFSEGQKNWLTAEIGDLCESLFAGGDIQKNKLSKFKTDKFNVPIFTNGEKNKGLYGFTDKAKVFKPSITVSARGTIGYSELRTEPFYPAVRLIVITPNTDMVETNYLKHAIKVISFVNTGSSIPQLTVPMVKKYKIKFPKSKDEQKKIVVMLNNLNSEITKLINISKIKAEKYILLKKSILKQELNNKAA